MTPGQPERVDYEYKRNGVANLFLGCEPLAGKRWLMVSERRTKVDWAYWVKDLVDVRYPETKRLILVADNLSTYTPAALYEVFAPEEAKRLVDRLEIHYTPEHRSWLSIAEIDWQCLDRRIPDMASFVARSQPGSDAAIPGVAQSIGG